MSEEYFKRKFGEILGEGGKPTPKTLVEIVESSGHSRATVLKWLERLESSGLVTRKPLIKGADALGSNTIRHLVFWSWPAGQ